MADNLDQAHADAGLQLLAATGRPVHDGVVPAGTQPPYFAVHTVIERPEEQDGNALDGLSSSVTVRWYVHCVGATAAAARAVAMLARSALLDVQPVIPGRVCGLIRQEAVEPPRRDETTGTPVMDLVQVYRLHTRPA